MDFLKAQQQLADGYKNQTQIETLILWGGRIYSILTFLYKEKHSETRNYVVFGTEDEFYSQKDIQSYRKSYVQNRMDKL